MTILPARTLREWFTGDPIGTSMLIVLLVILSTTLIKFYWDWPGIKISFNLASICIGGACP